MPTRGRVRLTDAAIARLRPREREYTVWDSRVAGLGVRVRPSGGSSYVMLRDAESGSRRVALGPVETMGIKEARRACLVRLAAGEPERKEPARAAPLLRDFVEGEWKKAHFERYKPSTGRGVSHRLRRRILPAFGAKPLDRITPAQVRRWFDDFSRTAPGHANHTLGQLRQIMNFAIACGYIEANPTRGIRRNRRPRLTRFLSREEIHRLHRALDRQTGESDRQQADIVRLLLLTGCRRGEIVHLRWSEVRDGMLALADAKTGPRTVVLNGQARRILDRQPRGESPFVFPSPLDPGAAALRTSRAVVPGPAGGRHRGLPPSRFAPHPRQPRGDERRARCPVVSRMLGHADVGTTLRYAHLGDRDIKEAAERVGQAVANLMELP